MDNRLSLPTVFPDSKTCIAAINALHSLYRAEHKRAASIDLFCSSFRDEHNIVLYTDLSPAHEVEAKWFASTLSTLYPSHEHTAV